MRLSKYKSHNTISTNNRRNKVVSFPYHIQELSLPHCTHYAINKNRPLQKHVIGQCENEVTPTQSRPTETCEHSFKPKS